MEKATLQIPKVLLVIESSRGHGSDLLRGISKYADLHGPWLFQLGEPTPFYRDGSRDTESSSWTYGSKWTPNGIITCNPELTKDLTEYGIPTILAVETQEEIYSSFPKIVLENEAIGQMAAQEFINRGYRNFAFCGFDDMFWSHQRGEGFCAKVKDAGFSVHFYKRAKLLRGKTSWEEEQVSIAEWLKQLPKPVGILACNDDFGRDIIEACKIEQVKVPEEVAVLGVDSDHMICNFCTPPLSSIVLDAEVAGYEVAKLLDKLMAGERPTEQTVVVRPLKVQTRHSTDIMAVSEDDVNNAIRFIYTHGEEYIQVSDVVNAVGVSRRRLQEKFCNVLGRTISDEIKRVRAEQIAKMLLDTDLTVQQIASKFGYNGLQHIARFFRNQTGFSPTEYRKKYGRR